MRQGPFLTELFLLIDTNVKPIRLPALQIGREGAEEKSKYGKSV